MAMFTERIKKDAIDSFDNFIIQAVLPEDDQIKGIVEHNRSEDDFPSKKNLQTYLLPPTVESSMSSANLSSASRIIT